MKTWKDKFGNEKTNCCLNPLSCTAAKAKPSWPEGQGHLDHLPGLLTSTKHSTSPIYNLCKNILLPLDCLLMKKLPLTSNVLRFQIGLCTENWTQTLSLIFCKLFGCGWMLQHQHFYQSSCSFFILVSVMWQISTCVDNILLSLVSLLYGWNRTFAPSLYYCPTCLFVT